MDLDPFPDRRHNLLADKHIEILLNFMASHGSILLQKNKRTGREIPPRKIEENAGRR
jgi:hypothetical protein